LFAIQSPRAHVVGADVAGAVIAGAVCELEGDAAGVDVEADAAGVDVEVDMLDERGNHRQNSRWWLMSSH
jgi:hypothetical protein